MASVQIFREESTWKCNPCRWTCTIDCGEHTCGGHKLKLFFKNFVESIVALFFMGQLAIGAGSMNMDIYSETNNFTFSKTNTTVCDIQNDDFKNINIQKLMVVTGCFGFLMMLFKMISFNIQVFNPTYIRTIFWTTFCFWSFWIISLALFTYNLVFLFTICGYFEKIFSVYIVSLIHNFFVIGILFLLFVNEHMKFSPHELKAIMSKQTY